MNLPEMRKKQMMRMSRGPAQPPPPPITEPSPACNLPPDTPHQEQGKPLEYKPLAANITPPPIPSLLEDQASKVLAQPSSCRTIFHQSYHRNLKQREMFEDVKKAEKYASG